MVITEIGLFFVPNLHCSLKIFYNEYISRDFYFLKNDDFYFFPFFTKCFSY